MENKEISLWAKSIGEQLIKAVEVNGILFTKCNKCNKIILSLVKSSQYEFNETKKLNSKNLCECI